MSITILCVVHSLVAREITRETLDELENLIKSYETSADQQTISTAVIDKPVDESSHVNAVEHSLTMLDKQTAKHCGRSERFKYQECITFAKSQDVQRNCAEVFVNAYQKCYFGKSLMEGDKDLHVCEGSCLWNFDGCLVDSSKVEMFVCINGRQKCRRNCPWPTYRNEKKGMQQCHNECEGTFDQCKDQACMPKESWVCAVARSMCRKDECGERWYKKWNENEMPIQTVRC